VISSCNPAFKIEGDYYEYFHKSLAIERMTKNEIAGAVQNPIEFLYPHIKGMVARDAFLCHVSRKRQIVRSQKYSSRGKSSTRISGSGQGPKRNVLGELVGESLESQLWLTRLSSGIKNLKRFNGEIRLARKIISDLKELTERVKIVHEWYRQQVELERDELNRQVSNLAIIESKKSIELANKSIEQAVSVKRKKHNKFKANLIDFALGLTQLAFFFIPLSFVTSFFGMNVEELSEGKSIKLWMFFVSSIALTTLVLIIWGVVAGKFSRRWDEIIETRRRKKEERQRQRDEDAFRIAVV
jgi:hypothetical protein